MTVYELICCLECIDPDTPVVIENTEVTEVLIREDMYLDKDNYYDEQIVVKLY